MSWANTVASARLPFRRKHLAWLLIGLVVGAGGMYVALAAESQRVIEEVAEVRAKLGQCETP